MKTNKRIVLLYMGEGKKPAADVKQIRELPGVTVVSDKDANVMIIEGPRGTLTAARKIPNWVASAEQATFHVDPPSPFLAPPKGARK